MGDQPTLGYLTALVTFRNDLSKDYYDFGTHISPSERRKIHFLAHYLGLEHSSDGQGDSRQVRISRPRVVPSTLVSQPQPPAQFYVGAETQRRGLNRAATIDFAETRAHESTDYSMHTLNRQASSLLGIPDDSISNPILRGAKSFADLRSYSPSPAASTTSFPPNLTQNASRYQEFHTHGSPAGTPNLTPTSAGGANRDEYGMNGLAHSLSGISFANDRPAFRPNGSSTSTIRPQERDNHAGPIGSQRPVNGNYDDSFRNGSTPVDRERSERQPRGPGADWQGFTRPRQNGHIARNSGKLAVRV